MGLIAADQSDNRTPFCSTGLPGLSALKAETIQPPAATRIGQQHEFEAFRYPHNHEQLHEALGQQPTSRRWQLPKRKYPRTPPKPNVPGPSPQDPEHTDSPGSPLLSLTSDLSARV